MAQSLFVMGKAKGANRLACRVMYLCALPNNPLVCGVYESRLGTFVSSYSGGCYGARIGPVRGYMYSLTPVRYRWNSRQGKSPPL